MKILLLCIPSALLAAGSEEIFILILVCVALLTAAVWVAIPAGIINYFGKTFFGRTKLDFWQTYFGSVIGTAVAILASLAMENVFEEVIFPGFDSWPVLLTLGGLFIGGFILMMLSSESEFFDDILE